MTDKSLKERLKELDQEIDHYVATYDSEAALWAIEEAYRLKRLMKRTKS